MSMDDPGWGSEIPIDEPHPPSASSGSPAAGAAGPANVSKAEPAMGRNQILGAAVVVAFVVAVIIVALISHKSTTKSTTTTLKGTTTTKVPQTTTTTLSLQAAGQQFLQLEQPADTQLTQFVTASNSWAPGTSVQVIASAADPLVQALSQFQNGILAADWPSTPASLSTDIKALSTATGTFASDLGEISNLTSSNLTAWEDQANKDSAVLTTADDSIRHDLGLPPNPLGTQ